MGTRSSRRRISGVDSHSSTPGGGFGDTPYLNSLRIVVGTQSVPANQLRILQPCAVCIRDKSLFWLVQYKRSGGWQPHIVAKNEANSPHSRDWWLWKRCLLFLESSINSLNGSPRILAGLLRDRLTHNYVSTAVLPSPRCALFAFSAGPNQFYPAHAHLSVSCLKRLRIMVVCMRAFIERNRINQHDLVTKFSLFLVTTWR